MSLHKIYSRYAKSLIELSKEQNSLEATIEDARFFREVLKVKEFRSLLKNPAFKPGTKIKIFDSVFKDKVSELFYKFIILVIKKGRERLLPGIIDEILYQYKKMLHITDIFLTTAVPMPEDFLEKLKTRLLESSITEEDVDITPKVDKDIIGGFIIKVEDNLIDASVKTKLKKIEKSIIETKYIRII